jgi:serine/threonine-protein kinase
MRSFITAGSSDEVTAMVAPLSAHGAPFDRWELPRKQAIRDRFLRAGFREVVASGPYLRVWADRGDFEEFFGGRVARGRCGLGWEIQPELPLAVGDERIVAVWFDSLDFGDTLGQPLMFGHYRAVEPLTTQGGLSEVWRAEHVRFGASRKYVLKRMGPSQAGADLPRARFDREARALVGVSHVNVVDIVDYDTRPEPYLVMEFLTGLTFHSLVADGWGPLPNLTRAVNLLVQACHGVRALHNRGLVHRDLKPKNLMVCEWQGQRDHVKVIDLGLVCPLRRLSVESGGTASGAGCGTLEYMAPEQFQDAARVTSTADIYALGCVAHFLLTGRPPFVARPGAAAHVSLWEQHLAAAPHPPSFYNPRVPADLDAVVLRCLEKDPGRRFQSAGDLIRGLESCRAPDRWSLLDRRTWWQDPRHRALAGL